MPSLATVPVNADLTFAIRGFGQVIFQGSVLSGVLFFVAVFISSPLAALYGLAGSILAAILSLHFSVPVVDLHIGLFSYNAVLCAIVSVLSNLPSRLLRHPGSQWF